MTTSTPDVDATRTFMERENQALNDAGLFDYVDELYAEDVVVNITRTGDDQPVVSRDDIKALYREWKTALDRPASRRLRTFRQSPQSHSLI